MRDVRPSKPKRSRPTPLASSEGRELYEASVAPKKHALAARARQTKKPPARQVSPKQEFSGRRVMKQTRPDARNAKVPITKVKPEAVKKKPQSHSGLDHVRKLPKFKLPHKARTKPRKEPGTEAKVGHGERKILLGLFGLVVVAGGIAAVIFLPTANITLRLRTAPLLVDESVRVGATAASDSKVIPGTAFFREIQVAGVWPVKNTETIGEIATGSVSIVNRTVSEQKIKERSRLVTDDGQLFYMLKPAFVPGNSSVAVQVEAAVAGEEGNIGPQRLNFAALDAGSQQLLFGELEEELTGGVGEIISVVGETDIESAKQAAAESARGQAETEIRSELPEGWLILEESWTGELSSFSTAEAVGDKTPNLNYEGRITVRVIGFEQAEFENQLKASLESRLEDEFALFPGPISYTKTVENVDWDNSQADLSVRVTHSTIPDLSLDTLREKLAGRSLADAEEYLEGLSGVRSAELNLWPFWARSLPRIEKRISLELEPENQP